MTCRELEEVALARLREWHSLIQIREVAAATSIARSVVEICKGVLNHTPRGTDPDIRNKALVFGVLFRGLEDYGVLAETTSQTNWSRNPTLVEKAWDKMWDCRQRSEYAAHFCQGAPLDWVLEKLGSLEEAFLAKFGPGLYSSPEILVKRETCSVCTKDFRSCEHLPGDLYDGVSCTITAQEVKLRNVAIVQIPVDPRCRIWPWHVEPDRHFRTRILTIFRLDDFIDESEDTSHSGPYGLSAT